ncbi:hypothetical protein [Halorubrum sp. N11]|uniref:hypothetical protein n=1 Tax=Halorubrum sp. N11 TaxID=3402276 RepID=UPI003EC0371E
MNRRSIVAGLIVIALVLVIGVIGAGLAVGQLSTVLDGEQRQPPALEEFDTAGIYCTDDPTANSSTSIRGGGANTGITYTQNISLPSRAHTVGDPTFERLNESTYLLSITTEETPNTTDCPGGTHQDTTVRYNASMRIPAGDDPWQVIIRHDRQNVTTIFGDSDSSLMGGSVSGGGEVSG